MHTILECILFALSFKTLSIFFVIVFSSSPLIGKLLPGAFRAPRRLKPEEAVLKAVVTASET